MGYKIITNNKDKWEVYDTRVEEVIEEFTTERDLKLFLVEEKISRAKLDAIELLMTFPNKWVVNDERIFDRSEYRIDDGFMTWLTGGLYEKSETRECYYKEIDRKLKEEQSK